MDQKQFKFKLSGKTLAIIDWANVYGWFSDLGWEIKPKKLFDYLSGYSEITDKRFYFGVEQGKQWSENLQKEISAIGFNLISKNVKHVPVSLEKSHFKKIVKNLFDVLDKIKSVNSGISIKLFDLRGKIEKHLAKAKPDYDKIYDLIEELDMELKKLNIDISELQKNLSLPVFRRKCDFDVEIARDTFNLADDFKQLILFSGDGDYAALVEDLTAKGKKVILVFAPGHKGKEYEDFKEGIFLCSVNRLKSDLC